MASITIDQALTRLWTATASMRAIVASSGTAPAPLPASTRELVVYEVSASRSGAVPTVAEVPEDTLR